MNNYITIKLNNNQEYIIVDTIDYNQKNYFLVIESQNEQIILNQNLIAYIYDESTNSLKAIESEEEYKFIFSIFESRLSQNNKIDEIIEEMIKMKVISIDGINYILETPTGNRLTKSIIFYTNQKPNVNNYIYMSKKILNETNIFQYGELYNLNTISKDEVIKIEFDDDEQLLQRYYG